MNSSWNLPLERLKGEGGEMPLSLKYEVSEDDIAEGTEWKISVRSGLSERAYGTLKITYPGDTTPPTTIISVTPQEINEGESVLFSAEASDDQDGYIVSYHWDFGDGDTNGREPDKNTCW